MLKNHICQTHRIPIPRLYQISISTTDRSSALCDVLPSPLRGCNDGVLPLVADRRMTPCLSPVFLRGYIGGLRTSCVVRSWVNFLWLGLQKLCSYRIPTPRDRVLHIIFFGFTLTVLRFCVAPRRVPMLSFLHASLPLASTRLISPWPVVIAAYACTRVLTGTSGTAHGPQCRYETFGCVGLVVALLFGLPRGVCAASPLLVCPQSWLWWSPKRVVLKRPASESKRLVSKRPASAQPTTKRSRVDPSPRAGGKRSPQAQQGKQKPRKDKGWYCKNGCLNKDGGRKQAQSGCNGFCWACSQAQGCKVERDLPKCEACHVRLRQWTHPDTRLRYCWTCARELFEPLMPSRAGERKPKRAKLGQDKSAAGEIKPKRAKLGQDKSAGSLQTCPQEG